MKNRQQKKNQKTIQLSDLLLQETLLVGFGFQILAGYAYCIICNVAILNNKNSNQLKLRDEKFIEINQMMRTIKPEMTSRKSKSKIS